MTRRPPYAPGPSGLAGVAVNAWLGDPGEACCAEVSQP